MTEKYEVELLRENRRMRNALIKIHEWKLPKVESQGEMVSYGLALGSNGERDFMRNVAKEGLGR